MYALRWLALRVERGGADSPLSRWSADAPLLGPTFYTFFYTAGRYRLVRSGTDRYVECAKPQLSGTKRDRTGPREGLTT